MRSKSHTIPCLPIQSVSSIAFHFSDSNGKSYIAAGGISPTNRIHVYVYQHDEHEGTSTWQKVDVDHNGKEHLETVSAVAFSKCGGRLASGCLASGRPVTTHAGLSKNRNVRLSSCIVYYKRQIGNQIQYDFITKVELQGHIMSMVFFPEVFCSAIAIGTSDTVKVYKEFNSGNHQDYELVKTPFEDDATMKKKGQVNALSCCPQSTLLSIGFAKMLQIFSYSEDDTHSVPTVSFTQIIEIYVGSSIVTSVFLPNFDTPMIAIGGDDCNLKVYCVATGQQHMSIPHNHTIRTVDFKSCGNYIATGSKDGVKIIDIWRKKVIQSFKTTTLCTHNQCSNTGNTGVPSISQIAKNGPHANSIRFGKTKITDISENLFIGSSMNKIIGLNMDILLRDTIHYFEDVKKSLTYFSPDGKWIVVGAHRCAQSSPSSMNVYKMSDLLSESNKLSDDVKIALEIKKAHHVHFSSDSTQILTATGQGGITIYEMSDNGTDWEVNPIISIDLTTKTNFITGALFSTIANDTILITDAKEVKLYHLHDRKVMGSRSFEQFNKLHAIVTPDMSKFVVIEPKQRFFPICDTTSLKEMCNDICEIKNLNTVALTDSTIAVADSNEVKIYNIFDDIDDALNSDIECPFNTPKHVDTFEVHAPVTVLSFNQDKTKLGVGCEDGRVLVYAMRSKSEEPSLFSFYHFPEKVTSLSFWNNSSQEFGNETIVLAITCGKHAIVQQFHKLNYSLCNPRDLNEDNYGCTIAAEFLMLFKDEDIIKAAKRNRSSGIQRGSLASGTLLTYSFSSEEDLSPHLPSSTPALTDMTESQIQSEAEMWKTKGNQHMGDSDYIKAYAAYSTALSLSPLGPTSHVFLTNRSAALLSLKRYPAAAMDAKRAITLAPSFGKAHARLGQSCYFQKQYKEAVDAYETALMYEPENKVTAVYLEKAKKKLGRELEQMERRKRREAAKHYGESREHGEHNMDNGSNGNNREINRTSGAAPPDPSGDYQSTHSTTQYISPNNSITNNSNNNNNLDNVDNDAISVDSSINTGMDAMSIIDDSESKGPLFRSKAVLGATYTTADDNNYGNDGNAPAGQLMEVQKSKALMERIQAVVEENYDEPNSNTKATPGKHRSTRTSSSSRNIPKEIGTNTNVSSSTNSDIRELAQSITNDLNTSAKQMAMRISSNRLKSIPAQVIPPSPSDEEKSQQDTTLNNDNDNANNNDDDDDNDDDEEDADFEEAIRLQEKATTHLSQKQYSHAVETYSAALFLVPDDINLTPQLFVGRAHALNGLLRHASAQNDAVMALNKQADYAEAHIVLGRSFFYMREYGNAIQSFERAKECLEYGYGIDHGIDGLTALDQLYLEKAKDAVNETLEKGKGFDAAAPGDIVGSSGGGGGDNEDDNRSLAFSILSKSSKPVPKLQPPPSVASRQEMKKSTTNVPPLPKEWADKIPYSPTSLRVGTERNVIFLSDSLGIKINRGPDGIVRILHITPITPGCAIVRKGQLHAGDVVREAAGVDLRRPITNVMWSDTVALLRIAPRPLTMIVAVELSELPPAIREEFNKAKNDAGQN